MPELPDICAYLHALERMTLGRKLHSVSIGSPFFLRSVQPSPDACANRRVREFRRLGKRIAIGLDGDYWLVLHLMIAGRLQWKDGGTAPSIRSRNVLAALRFDNGTLLVTEAGSKKRASLYVVQGKDSLLEHDPGGLEVLDADVESFSAAIRSENRTLKRALTDPRILSGIGNAYSDEILHAAGLSPVQLTSALSDDAVRRLHASTVQVLRMWTDRLVGEAESIFPKKVTAFRPEMAVHGRYRKPCPVCATPIQRIRYASSETNYCPQCQTGGKVLKDRSLSRILKDDWPRSIDELERPG